MADPITPLEYTRDWTNPLDFPSLAYTRDWNSPSDFPTIELDETTVRADMQCLYDEIKDYINGTGAWSGEGLSQYLGEYLDLVVSYAIGGTGTRQGEDTDNAKYYCEESGRRAQSASESALSALGSEKTAKSYAVGGTDTRPGENTDNAKYYKEQAYLSAEDANTKARQAAGSAETAEDAASVALQQAGVATQRAADAAESAGNAAGYANAANTSAQAASSSEKTAKSYAVGGTGTRQGEETDNAKYYKNQAYLSAEDASTKAQQAAGSAETAEDAASVALQQAGLAAGSATAAAASAADAAERVADIYKAFPTESSSGMVASTAIGADDIPLERLVVRVVSSQDLHGFPAPWIAGGGGNLWDSAENPLAQGAISSSDGTNVASTTRVRCADYVPVEPNTTYTIAAGGGADVFLFFYSADGTYVSASTWQSLPRTFTVPEDISKIRFVIRRSDGSPIAPTDVSWITVVAGANPIPYENICPIRGWSGAQIVVSPTSDAQDGTLYAVVWTAAGVIGDGILTDNGNGTWTLVVTHLYRQFDGTEGWQDFSGGGTYSYFGIYLDLPSDSVVDDTAICSHTVDNPEIGRNNTQLGFRVWNRGASLLPSVIFRFSINQSETDFTAYLAAQAAAETPVTVRFELAESARQTYTINADSVKSLLGVNNVWADTGDVEAVFRADPALYVNKKIESIGLAIIAQQPVDYVGAIGSTASFTVIAEGDGLTYQWQLDSGAGWKNVTSAGAKTATMKVGMTEARLAYLYRCIVTGANNVPVISKTVRMFVG